MDERFLIIETSHRPGQVALAEGTRVLGCRRLEEARRHARDLAPQAGELLKVQGWKAKDITAVIVSLGPGSFTGLRVGIISAKTFAYATGAKLVGIETFAAIARQAPAEAERVDVIADAQQGKIYIQSFTHEHAGSLMTRPGTEWLQTRPPEAWVSGPGLEQIGAHLPPEVRKTEASSWLPWPQTLLNLALERLARGERDDPFALVPLYVRVSAPEEKLLLNR